jgi:hypothetical protein
LLLFATRSCDSNCNSFQKHPLSHEGYHLRTDETLSWLFLWANKTKGGDTEKGQLRVKNEKVWGKAAATGRVLKLPSQ